MSLVLYFYIFKVIADIVATKANIYLNQPLITGDRVCLIQLLIETFKNHFKGKLL